MMSETGQKRTTIQDIANEARVSISTVSRVLNGNVVVRQDKREAVLKAVKRLKYRPNVFAQGLASGQSMTIGVLTQQISSPFYDSILYGMLGSLRGTGYSPLIADGHLQADKEQRAVEALMRRRVDGLIVLGPTSDDDYLQALAERVPLVVIGRDIPPIQCICMDNYGGAYIATRHLIDLGHRSIAHITGISTHPDSIARCAGYKDALTEAEIEVDESLIVEGQFSEQSGVLAVEMLLMRGKSFSAIFAANDQMAYGVRLALFRRGIRVPDDISIAGYDDQSVSAYVIPPLTTMRQPATEIGRTASDTILKLMKEEEVGEIRFSADLIVRESTARFR